MKNILAENRTAFSQTIQQSTIAEDLDYLLLHHTHVQLIGKSVQKGFCRLQIKQMWIENIPSPWWIRPWCEYLQLR